LARHATAGYNPHRATGNFDPRADLKVVAYANSTFAPWLQRIGLLKAAIVGPPAQVDPFSIVANRHDRPPPENSDDTLKKLERCRAHLAQAQAEIATLSEDNRHVRAQHAEIAERAAHLVEHNRLLTEAATESARQLQEQTPKLTQAYTDIAALSEENQRLRGGNMRP
jgi:hypothetical protein